MTADLGALPVADAADMKVRAATVPKSPVTDPDAPFGYMTDPVTKQVRPRKRPGKQAKSAPAPPSRPSNASRQRAAAPGEGKAKKNYTAPLTETFQGVWMLMAGVPTPKGEVRVLGVDLQSASLRLKAQASVLEDNGERLVSSINMMAQHNAQVARGIEKITADSGPAWILPAMMALVPFAVQSAAVWTAPVENGIRELAEKTEAQFDELFRTIQSQATNPEPTANDEHPAG